MAVEKAIIDRIKSLIEIGTPMSPAYNETGLTFIDAQQVTGWVTSSANAVDLIFGLSTSPYKMQCMSITSKLRSAFGTENYVNEVKQDCVGEMVSLLEHLLIDLEAGLISSIVNQVRAEAFDDFLDHADLYLKGGRKNESGVIAGVVFEDTVRRIGGIHDVSHKDLEQVINGLSSKDVISGTKAKRAKAGAHVRTKATHADWDEFELEDVKATIGFTRELISTHLDA